MSVVALVGAQYGSEGKGAIAKHIAHDYNVHVRTGAPNAGHTIYKDKVRRETYDFTPAGSSESVEVETERVESKKYAMRSIPCGWVCKNAHLVIGRGAVVDIDLLLEEVDMIEADGYEIATRLFVDEMASVLDPVRHAQKEGGVHGYAHQAIGSTGEGVGPCRMARMARGTFRDEAWAKLDLVRDKKGLLEARGIRVTDTVRSLNSWIDMGAKVLLEGTQGSALSLVHGPWPKVTSWDANAAQLLVDAGIAPIDFTRTILVARTYPIRVAGDSGPMFNETTWEKIGVEPEITTVTKKVRRVGEWDYQLIKRSIMLNRPAVLALTFYDYWEPECAGMTDIDWLARADRSRRIKNIESEQNIRITYVGTGPDSVIDR